MQATRFKELQPEPAVIQVWAVKQDHNFRGCCFKNTAASQKNLGNLRERNQGRENNLELQPCCFPVPDCSGKCIWTKTGWHTVGL